MPRRKVNEIDGGKINIGKEFKKIGRTLNKKVFKPTEKGFQTAGKTLGRITNKELLPAVKTIGIPMASGVAGAVGTMYGGPIGGVMASQLTSGLLNQYVPGQSKNPYIGLTGDALSMGMFGSDPMEEMQLMGKVNKQLSSDILGKDVPDYKPSMRPQYNPNNPYEDLISQLYQKYNVPTPAPVPPIVQPQPEDLRDDFDAMYGESELGDNADSMIVVKPPYQQREGSVQGLLGVGMLGAGKKKRGRKKKIPLDYDPTEPKKRRRGKKAVEVVNIEKEYKPREGKKVQRVEVIKYLPYEKFTHAPNDSLKQLLQATNERETREANKAMINVAKEMKSQFDDLKRERDFYKEALGAGVRGCGFKKGSKEAKEHMVKIRAMRGKK